MVSFPRAVDDEAAGRVLPDPSFDRYARMVQSTLNVPVSLVTIIEPDRQVFPGAAGLPPEVEDDRQTPLSYSFCKHVVYEGVPVIVADARLDPRVSDNPSIEEFGIRGYAGFPLTDSTGAVIGSLCAMDHEPRAWTRSELGALEDLAAACSTEIALRELRRRAARSARDAYDVAHRARVLLALSKRLARTRTIADVARALLRVAIEELECCHAGIWVLDSDDPATLRYVRDPHLSWPQAEYFGRVRLVRDNPFGATLLTGEPLFFADRRAEKLGFPTFGGHDLPEDGVARTYLPLVIDDRAIGCLVLLWLDQREFSDDDQVMIGALTVSTATALQRACLLADRATVAAKLQSALLTELPHPEHLELAARYRTARAGDQVGGDWYDAVVLPNGATSLVIGDVSGHDVDAAAAMGPLRSMLRAFVWDREENPSAHVARLDRAIRDLHPGTLCTLILARIGPAGDDRPVLRWTNAGHPAPLLLHPDGSCETLEGAGVDCLLGIVPDRDRHDGEVSVEPGATLILFTDGLIERPREHLDAGRARLVDTVRANQGSSVDDLLDAVVEAMVGSQPIDDVAVLAARFR